MDKIVIYYNQNRKTVARSQGKSGGKRFVMLTRHEFKKMYNEMLERREALTRARLHRDDMANLYEMKKAEYKRWLMYMLEIGALDEGDLFLDDRALVNPELY